MSKGSYYPRAPFNCRSEPVSKLEIEESGPLWPQVREMRNTVGDVYRFRTKREVAMAVLLWELRQAYTERRSETFPDHYTNEERDEWFQEQARMQVIIDRIDECLTMII